MAVSEGDISVMESGSEGRGSPPSALLASLRHELSEPAFWLLAALSAGVLWGLWPNLVSMNRKWLQDPRYSHGVLVPLFSIVLGYLRAPKGVRRAEVASWWGVALILSGASVQIFGAYIFIEWVETLSIVFYIAGLIVLYVGAPAVRWVWAPVAFLVFMVPLPYLVETAMGGPLQRFATLSSTFLLQTLGLTAGAEGNTIVLESGRIGVVEQCNGLGILFTFLATACAVALIVDRPSWQKCLVVISAVPIALVANVSRITATGYLHETVGGPTADVVYHDVAGWLMMPFALFMLWAELGFFSLLVVESEDVSSASVGSTSPILRGEANC